MFDFLKKKISGFVDKLTKKEEKKAEGKPPEKKRPEKKEAPPEKEKPPKVEKPAKPKEIPTPVKPKEKLPEKIPEPKKEERPIPPPEKAKVAEKPKEIPKPVERPKIEKKAPVEKPKAKEAKTPEPKKPGPPPKVEERFPGPKARPVLEPEIKPEEPPVIEKVEEPPEPEVKPEAEERPKERMKIGAISAIKSFITKEVEITEGDVGGLLEEFELELLESDVDLSVAESIKEELSEKLIGSKIKKDELHVFINQTMKETLVDMLSNEDAFDILERMKGSEKPVRIMFLGINGAGKTTTIAKVAKLLLDNDYKIVFAAADTFRAAAIEQMQVHADRLGVRVIKRDYGSDPTSVAYDATGYAKAHGIDAVLIDTAGRQDTNISLINEMKKMTRVIQPELKIYIGESIAGQAILEQIKTFDREIGLDAVILTKLDCDPKGGTMLSINKATGIPIIYVGVGQRYEDLELFDARSIVDRIVE